jgi:hypothetical protein
LAMELRSVASSILISLGLHAAKGCHPSVQPPVPVPMAVWSTQIPGTKRPISGLPLSGQRAFRVRRQMLEMVPDGLDRLRATWAKKPEIFIGDVQMGSEDLQYTGGVGLNQAFSYFPHG